MLNEALTIETLDSPGGTRTFRLSGPLTITTVFPFQSQVRGDAASHTVLDFTGVPYIDSAGIGALMGAYVSRQKGGRTLKLAGVTKRVHDALKIAKVDTYFTIMNAASG
jgi:anti-sigma B factor antagonist